MRLFNSFQIVAAFVAWPFLVSWLATDPFPAARLAMIAAGALYIVAFGAMVSCVYKAVEIN